MQDVPKHIEQPAKAPVDETAEEREARLKALAEEAGEQPEASSAEDDSGGHGDKIPPNSPR